MPPKAAAPTFQDLDDLFVVCDAVHNNIRVQVLRGNITRVNSRVIVNASNTALRSGNGINGQIHAADGPGLMQELIAIFPGTNPGQTGMGYITGTHNLFPHVNAIVHAVGPSYPPAGAPQPSPAVAIMLGAQLRATYINSLDVANRVKLVNDIPICFPSISTGIFRFPQPEAARLALTAIRDWINVNPVGQLNAAGQFGHFNRIVVLLWDPNTAGNIDPNEAHYLALFR